MQTSVMQIEDIAQGGKPENPAVAFHIDQRLIDRVTEGGDNAPQDVRRIPLYENDGLPVRIPAAISGASARLRSFAMLAQIGVKRVRAGLGEQGRQHHVLAAAFGEMLAIGLAQGAYAGVAVFCDARSLSRRANAV